MELVLYIGIPLLLLIYFIILYNRLIRLKNNRKQALGDIDVQLKVRFNLIPNLVTTVQGYAKHEKELFSFIAEARSGIQQGKSGLEQQQAENQLSQGLKTLFAVAENYPDLKANKSFLDLQKNLHDVEYKIAAARRFYNHATKEFNSVIQMFPSNIVAGVAQMKSQPYFELSTSEEAEPISIRFDKS